MSINKKAIWFQLKAEERMKHLEVIQLLLAIQGGKTETIAQRLEQLTFLEKEQFFYHNTTWLLDGGQLHKDLNGAWVCFA